jgi:hypothetical protein
MKLQVLDLHFTSLTSICINCSGFYLISSKISFLTLDHDTITTSFLKLLCLYKILADSLVSLNFE